MSDSARARRLACLLALLSVGPAACGGHSGAESCGHPRLGAPLLVLERERDTSAVGVLRSDGCLSEVASLDLGGDPVLATSRGRLFVLARDLGTAVEIDADGGVVAQTAVYSDGEPRPPGCPESRACHNPHDLAVDDSGALWVTRYDAEALAVVQTTPRHTIERVELGQFADADERPEMEGIVLHNGRAFISLELLDFTKEGSPPSRPGALAVVDVASRRVEPTLVDLGGRNPLGRLTPAFGASSQVAVALIGDPDAIDATGRDGIATVDLESLEVTHVVTEPSLGGSAVEVVAPTEREAYAIVAGPEPGVNPTRVVRFDPMTGDVTAVLADSSRERPGFYHAGLAVSGNHVVVGDRTPGRARLLIYDRKSLGTPAEVALDLYPPVGLAFAVAVSP